MCYVPAWFGQRNSRKMVKAFSMIDNCSQGLFIIDKIIEDHGISGRY